MKMPASEPTNITARKAVLPLSLATLLGVIACISDSQSTSPNPAPSGSSVSQAVRARHHQH
ncbi:hypothetical protein GCM10020219_100790 [Nonomuraea dietziae]